MTFSTLIETKNFLRNMIHFLRCPLKISLLKKILLNENVVEKLTSTKQRRIEIYIEIFSLKVILCILRYTSLLR